MWFAESISRVFRVLVIALSKVISVAMMLGGLLIALCIVADNLFHLGWGYPWWSLFFCIIFIALSAMIYRAIPSLVAHVERQIGGNAGNRNGRTNDN